MAGGQRSADEVLSDINITPLVDVMLVLLVVMMVTASFAVSQALEVNLPQGSTGESSTAPLTLVVDAAGAWSLGGKPVDREALAKKLSQHRAGADPLQVVIAADGAAPHRFVVAAMDWLRARRVTSIALGIQPEQ